MSRIEAWYDFGNKVERASYELKVRDVIKLVEADGWYQVSMEGDHRQYKHPIKRGRVTIAGHPGKEVPPGTLASIFKQAQIVRRK